jgi:UDPglucose 6-dehydrogenase
MQLAVIGLGKLGLPFAETLAERHTVLGYDIAPRTSAAVRVVDSVAAALDGSDATFVVLPTPHEPRYDGSQPTATLPPRDFDYQPVRAALADVAAAAKPGVLVVLVSTVLPGTVRREFAPLCERVELVYSPAFMAMGQVRQDFLDPEFRLIGSADGSPAAGRKLQDVFRSFGGSAPVHLLTWEEAEAIKIFYNTFISAKLALVNMVQDVAQTLGHIDVDRVTTALTGATRRIVSPMYMRSGMGDGGPCHPRDLLAMRALAERYALGYDIFSAIATARDQQAKRMAGFLLSFGLPVLLTSRSYKPGVAYVDGSSALLVAHFVAEAGGTVTVLDDVAAMPAAPHCILLVHDVDHSGLTVPSGSIVVDPWRRYKNPEVRVVHYGNTRDRQGG